MIVKLLKSNSEDTEMSPLRILSKSISESAKRFEAYPKSGKEWVLGFSDMRVWIAFCFLLSGRVLLSATVSKVSIFFY